MDVCTLWSQYHLTCQLVKHFSAPEQPSIVKDFRLSRWHKCIKDSRVASWVQIGLKAELSAVITIAVFRAKAIYTDSCYVL